MSLHGKLLRFPSAMAVLALGATLLGCDRDAGGALEESSGEEDAFRAPTVTPDAGDLVLTWLDDEGRFRVADRVADIPEERRGAVRVQDPTHPPPDPSVIWLADLREPSNGRYPVKLAKRSELEARAKSARPAPTAPPPPPDASPAASSTTVVMYVTSTCPVCRRARSWLARQGVSFVERDIGRSEEAARELQEKARRQGIRADGVPVFDVGGTLIAGFDQARLRAALGL